MHFGQMKHGEGRKPCVFSEDKWRDGGKWKWGQQNAIVLSYQEGRAFLLPKARQLEEKCSVLGWRPYKSKIKIWITLLLNRPINSLQSMSLPGPSPGSSTDKSYRWLGFRFSMNFPLIKFFFLGLRLRISLDVRLEGTFIWKEKKEKHKWVVLHTGIHTTTAAVSMSMGNGANNNRSLTMAEWWNRFIFQTHHNHLISCCNFPNRK